MKKVLIFLFLFFTFIIYSVFVYTEGTCSVNNRMNQYAIEGKFLYQKYNCTSCHQLYGLGGYLGPELTTVISQSGKGKQYAETFLKYGSTRMPDFHLNEKEVKYLLEYLEYVDSSAISYKRKM